MEVGGSPSKRPAPVVGTFGLPVLVRNGLAALLREEHSPVAVVEVTGRSWRTPSLLVWDPARTDPALDPEVKRMVARGTHVLLFTARPTPALIGRGVAVDAAGILPPSLTGGGFVEIVGDVVLRGEPVGPRPQRRWAKEDHLDGLTPRETEILGRICAGMKNRDIADELHLSINSVKTYVRSAYRKIGVERRSEAVIWGAQHGLVQGTPAPRPVAGRAGRHPVGPASRS